MSAPSSRGFCKYGVRNVLSTIVRSPFSFAILTTPLISVISSRGLEGVSINIATVSGFTASFTLSRSVVSTNVYLRLNFANMSVMILYVPP